MPKTISAETKKLISELYAKNFLISEIAKLTKVSNMAVYGLTKLQEKINPATGVLFESLTQYQDFQARNRLNPETGHNFESVSQYKSYLVRHRTNPGTSAYFESLSQYRRFLGKQRSSAPENQELGVLITRRLVELKKSQSWLSREIGVSKQAVSKYIKGNYSPGVNVLEKLSFVIKVPYSTLDSLLK